MYVHVPVVLVWRLVWAWRGAGLRCCPYIVLKPAPLTEERKREITCSKLYTAYKV